MFACSRISRLSSETDHLGLQSDQLVADTTLGHGNPPANSKTEQDALNLLLLKLNLTSQDHHHERWVAARLAQSHIIHFKLGWLDSALPFFRFEPVSSTQLENFSNLSNASLRSVCLSADSCLLSLDKAAFSWDQQGNSFFLSNRWNVFTFGQP